MNPKITGTIKSAAEITGQEGCVAFEGRNWSYPRHINEIAGHTIEITLFDNHGYGKESPYDYRDVESFVAFKKSWLKDIREEMDLSSLKVDDKVEVSDDGLVWEKRYFEKIEDGKFYCYNDGATSWSSDDISTYWYFIRKPIEMAAFKK